MAAAQPQPREGVIRPFPNEGGEGWLLDRGRAGHLSYSGQMVQGKAEGRGTIRSKYDRCTIRGAEFRGGAMLPSRAVFAFDTGNAFAGPLAATGLPADNARGAYVRGSDGGRFEGTWPANSEENDWGWDRPLRGVAWVADGGSVHAVELDDCAILSAGSGWRPGGAGWVHEGVLTRPDGQAAFEGIDPLWAEEEHTAKFVSKDGWVFEGAFCGLRPLRGVLADADGRRWRVVYSGDEWFPAQPVTKEEVTLESALAGLAPDAAAAAADLLRKEEVTAAQLRSGEVADEELELIGLDSDARAAISAWRAAAAAP